TTHLAPGISPYGFTGEFTESTGMIYLRARHYDPALGRFLTRDTWDGNINKPLSLNRWNYTSANPVNLKDPSGHDPYWCEKLQDPVEREKCYLNWILNWQNACGTASCHITAATITQHTINNRIGLYVDTVITLYGNPDQLKDCVFVQWIKGFA